MKTTHLELIKFIKSREEKGMDKPVNGFANSKIDPVEETEEWFFSRIMDNIQIELYVTDPQTDELLFMNQTMKQAFGVEHLEGKRCWEVLQQGMTQRCGFCPLNRLTEKDLLAQSVSWEERNTKNGRIYENHDSLIPWIDGRLVHLHCGIDVTETKQMFEKAAYDELTGVLSRRAGKERLQQRLDQGRSFVVCMLDANDLKVVNDSKGHQAGDALLVSITEAIEEQLSPQDEIFRMGGDEFVVLFDSPDREEALEKIHRALQALRTPEEQRDRFSFGLTQVSCEVGHTISGVLYSADTDMYLRKRRRHILQAEQKLKQGTGEAKDPASFQYNKDLLYDALVKSTDHYLFVCDMHSGIFRYPQTMVDEFELPGQVIENAAAVWGSHVYEQDKEAFLTANQDITEGRTDRHCVEYRAKNRKGEWVWLRCRGQMERDEMGNPSLFAGFITNLGNRNRIDHLTGLFNKLVLEEECTRLLGLGGVTLLLFGIDDLKHINGLFDRDFGDQVIRIVAQRIQSFLPVNAEIYRLDGDQMAVLIRGEERAVAKTLYHSVQEAFSMRQTYDNKTFFCTLSCGCAFSSGLGTEYQTFLKQAVSALESAKQNGKNRLVFFSPELLNRRNRSLVLTDLLRESVENDFSGFRLVYQPIYNRKQKLVGAEALCRWSCPRFGEVPPGEFIPLLEDSGLILRVGKWVFRQAAGQCAGFLQRYPDFLMSVNLSWLQLEEPSLTSFLSRTAADAGVGQNHIMLELTESYLAEHWDRMSKLLEQLRGDGFLVAMDDFGTGFSSLSLLRQAPLDLVKLDGSFVREIEKSPYNQAFIRLVGELCRILGMKLCLEGVETSAEYALVHPLNLDLVQGFLFGKPCTGEEFIKRYICRKAECEINE